MVELETILSLRDAYDLLEIIMVDAHNQRILNKAAAEPE